MCELSHFGRFVDAFIAQGVRQVLGKFTLWVYRWCMTKKIILVVGAVLLLGYGLQNTAQGVTAKPVTQKQITKLQNQIYDMENELAYAQVKIGNLETQLSGFRTSRSIFLTLTGLKGGCGVGNYPLDPFLIPNSPISITPCATESLVQTLG